MSLQSIVISGYNSGAIKNKKPFLITDDAFADLTNAYVYREELRKREGLQLIGRYRRYFTGDSLENSGASPWTLNVLSTEGIKGSITGITNANPGEITTEDPHNLIDGTQVIISGVLGMTEVNGQTVSITSTGLNTFTIGISTAAYGVYTSGGIWTLATEPNSEIEAGSVIITIQAGPDIVFTDQGDGTLTSPTAGNSGTINYLSGEIVLTHTAGAGVASIVTFGYFPALPAMGISVREIAGINAEESIWFDTKYAYIYDGVAFQEYLPSAGVTWNGTDSDFFWSTNYRGAEAQERLFFTTNFVANAGSPMRYTDDSTWIEFKPIVSGTKKTEVFTTSLASGSAAYNAGVLTNLPIIEGTVVITVKENPGAETSIVFRDTQKDGTLQAAGSNTGTIVYTTGAITLSFSPVLPGAGPWTVTAVYDQATNYLFTARILIPYYGRLLALNTYEGTTVGSSVNIYNRCRFSQVGNPIQQDAWRSDTFGKGGFIDAPVNEDIIAATFYKNTLIVRFERSTWRLQYIGEYGTPFIWERISSDFGSESTFADVLFDSGVLSVGDKAITGSSGSDVQRIDLDIPDTVYAFKNAENGVKRVHGIRDFKNELVFWCYPDYPTLQTNQYFPNKTLVYNYRNETFAFFRNNVTCFGNFQYPADITWDRLDIFWDDEITWDSGIQTNYPTIASGNQQGFAHFYGYPDDEISVDSTIDANDQESLAVKSVTVTTVVNLEVPNHNLLTDEVIYLAGLIYLNGSVAGSTTLNNHIYFVNVVDEDNFEIGVYDVNTGFIDYGFDVTNVGDYVGGGVLALFPKMEIITKDFNPAKQAGLNIKTSYVDFLFDTSASTAISVTMKMNTNVNNKGNLLIGNKEIETSNVLAGNVQGILESTVVADDTVIYSKNHGLLNGKTVLFSSVGGTVELNGNEYTTTFVDVDHFKINVSFATLSAYTSGGYWSQNDVPYWSLSADYTWHRFFATTYGQYVSLILSYSDEQMSQLRTHQQHFALNAMQIYYLPGGKNIFGK